ncbi:MAG: alginate lyase family protein, partial [Thermoleophilia bacterium]|nr:alginate lyase family protein [Thermoleophilia bacterium]
MGPHPVAVARSLSHAATRRGRQRILKRTYASRVARPPLAATLTVPALDLPPAHELPPHLADPAELIRTEAEEILAHRVDLLGSGLVSLGEEIDWHRDFKSGHRWPVAFYQDVAVTRLDDESDAKVPWELSRGHQLLTLARAARLFEDERFSLELERQLGSWIEANPPGFGINWTNAMEVGLRGVNWIWVLATLGGRRPLDPETRRSVTRSLQCHGRHIAANLEASPWLRSNHYLGDLLGLLALGASLEGDPAAGRWLRFAHRELEHEIQGQVHPDGLGFEASLPYHGLALEIFLLAKHVAERARVPFSPAYHARLRRMLEASRAVRHPDGRLPNFGDNDSGRVLPAGFARPLTHDHLLWLGSALLASDRPLPGEPHEEVAWTLGVDRWRACRERDAAAPPTSSAFPDGGVYVLRGERAHAVVRCGDVGQRGNGGHAHNDALAFELSAPGPLVLDSGTYAYTSDPAARNAFRATAAHSTVAVAGAEINPIDETALFELEGAARPVVELWEEGGERVRLVASHDGFCRVTPPVVHRRTFVLERAGGGLEVVDELLG